MPKKYIVRLSGKERSALDALVHKGSVAAYKRKHAQILLKADASKAGPAWRDQGIADAFDVTVRTVERVRERLCQHGLEVALNRAKRPPQQRKLDGVAEAQLIALACSEAPEGRKKWSLRLLAQRFVQLDEVLVDSISHEGVRRVLKKKNSNRG